ncbi:hypothetical protein H696_01947 [Fonticula alba]|uniref:XPG N-terminal domain-containing protein n=1 Tax=Fonticula alba TaxID=691883 RepID=A0A058ZAN4_FONAL|nr:hypothetical protein H696_01947 [Fonticula alba]KCV71001.1 hypothetical protein H696_01947 [Fonticula alba]|eukprot:XP_009494124.1 hypothetical protein H696_01947 [Fonticula alba]
MGVQQLWSLVDPAGRPVDFRRDLEGKRVAVDGSGWLHALAAGFRHQAERDALGPGVDSDQARRRFLLLHMVRRVLALYTLGVTHVVVVFDHPRGGPPLKEKVLAARRAQRALALSRAHQNALRLALAGRLADLAAGTADYSVPASLGPGPAGPAGPAVARQAVADPAAEQAAALMAALRQTGGQMSDEELQAALRPLSVAGRQMVLAGMAGTGFTSAGDAQAPAVSPHDEDAEEDVWAGFGRRATALLDATFGREPLPGGQPTQDPLAEFSRSQVRSAVLRARVKHSLRQLDEEEMPDDGSAIKRIRYLPLKEEEAQAAAALSAEPALDLDPAALSSCLPLPDGLLAAEETPGPAPGQGLLVAGESPFLSRTSFLSGTIRRAGARDLASRPTAHPSSELAKEEHPVSVAGAGAPRPPPAPPVKEEPACSLDEHSSQARGAVSAVGPSSSGLAGGPAQGHGAPQVGAPAKVAEGLEAGQEAAASDSRGDCLRGDDLEDNGLEDDDLEDNGLEDDDLEDDDFEDIPVSSPAAAPPPDSPQPHEPADILAYLASVVGEVTGSMGDAPAAGSPSPPAPATGEAELPTMLTDEPVTVHAAEPMAVGVGEPTPVHVDGPATMHDGELATVHAAVPMPEPATLHGAVSAPLSEPTGTAAGAAATAAVEADIATGDAIGSVAGSAPSSRGDTDEGEAAPGPGATSTGLTASRPYFEPEVDVGLPSSPASDMEEPAFAFSSDSESDGEDVSAGAASVRLDPGRLAAAISSLDRQLRRDAAHAVSPFRPDAGGAALSQHAEQVAEQVASLLPSARGSEPPAPAPSSDGPGLLPEADHPAAMAFTSPDLMDELAVALLAVGAGWLTARTRPGGLVEDAEARCGLLSQRGQVDVVLSDDNDALLFGSRTVVRGLFGSRPGALRLYSLAALRGNLGLSRSRLIQLAHLLGSDFSEGLFGVGPVLACEILAAFADDHDEAKPDVLLQRFAAWWRGYPNMTPAARSGLSPATRALARALGALRSPPTAAGAPAEGSPPAGLRLPEDFPDPRVTALYLHVWPSVGREPREEEAALADLAIDSDALFRVFRRNGIHQHQAQTDGFVRPAIERRAAILGYDAAGSQVPITHFFYRDPGSERLRDTAPDGPASAPADGDLRLGPRRFDRTPWSGVRGQKALAILQASLPPP